MSSNLAIHGVTSPAARPQAAPAPKPAAQAVKSEAQETVQVERNEALRGTPEAGEAKPAQRTTSGVGSRVNLTA